MLFFVFTTFAQNGSAKINIIQPSPNSAALAKYVDFPTIQASAVPSISLPPGALGSKDISLPVSLNYHAGEQSGGSGIMVRTRLDHFWWRFYHKDGNGAA